MWVEVRICTFLYSHAAPPHPPLPKSCTGVLPAGLLLFSWSYKMSQGLPTSASPTLTPYRSLTGHICCPGNFCLIFFITALPSPPTSSLFLSSTSFHKMIYLHDRNRHQRLRGRKENIRGFQKNIRITCGRSRGPVVT